MFERFSDRARKVMALANQEAQRFNHEYVGTEHILLGIVKEGGNVAANVLKNMDVDLRKVRLEVEKLIKSGPDMVVMGKLPQTPRAKKVIELSIVEARNLNHNYVGTEHILLGLLAEHDGVAAQVLMNLGCKIEDVRLEILNLIGAATDNEKKPVISVTSPVAQSVAAAELSKQIAELEAKKDSLVKSAEYEAAVRVREQAEELKKALAALKTKCSNCKNDATVHLKELKNGLHHEVHLCDKCATQGATPFVTKYTDVTDLTPNQLHQLISAVNTDSPAQPLLEALHKVETGLFEVLASLTNETLVAESDSTEVLETVIETANFIKEFTKFRDKLLS